VFQNPRLRVAAKRWQQCYRHDGQDQFGSNSSLPLLQSAQANFSAIISIGMKLHLTQAKNAKSDLYSYIVTSLPFTFNEKAICSLFKRIKLTLST
jgi:hypothetical protein